MGELSRFAIGDAVRRRNAPDQVGIVRAVVPNEQMEDLLYKIQFGTQSKTVSEADLEHLPAEADLWADLVAGRTEGAATYQRLLTFERLRRPPSRVATSFGTARAKLLPYQFKPLLKFLDSPNQRILIADDVGLGKTLEAGYILKELKARHGLERVLIVVPARLRTKWKMELDRRFDEAFEIVSARDVRDRFIEPYRRGSDPSGFAWIASYESLRGPDISQALAELQPPIDLVILDEAHKVRNSSTQQHALAKALSNADAMVLLTATPIQTSRENLFQLLRLIDPETFERYDVFEAQLLANRPVVQALAAIRHNPPQLDVAREQLEAYRSHPLTRDLAKNEFFADIFARLHPEAANDRRALVDVQRDLSELNLTSQVLSRTRKVEVMPDRPIRRAHAIKVVLTPDEKRVYDAIAQAVLLVNPSQGWGATMAALMAVRYAASCLPAAHGYFRSKFGATLDALCGDVGHDSPDDTDTEIPGIGLGQYWQAVKADLDATITVDSKLARFREALDELWHDDRRSGTSPRKVIVFSFFKGTLAYLARRLAEAGVRANVIHGGISVADRESIIDDFLSNREVQVLLSSEVGSEGLDLQQASVVINYDLPWNPMVVEQRIGRIDRLGQESKVLTILSLVLADTIEDRILYRLYERIGVFRETIGEIEPILGDQIERLAAEALRNALTPEEQERQADEAADAFLNEQRQGTTLQQQADQLIAGDQAFLDEIQSLIGERRVPSPSELYRFLAESVRRLYPGSSLPDRTLEAVSDVVFDVRMAVDLIEQLGPDPELKRVASRIQQGAFPLTFNPDAHMRRPRSELVSMHHPLVRLACAFLDRDAEQMHRTFHLKLGQSAESVEGTFVLAVLEFAIAASRPRTELVPVFWNCDTGQPLDGDIGRRLFIQLLDDAVSVEGALPCHADELEQSIARMKRHLVGVHADLKTREAAVQSARAARRRATQRATFDARVRTARLRLRALEDRQAGEFAIRMARAKLEQEQNRLNAFRRETDDTGVRVEVREIAVALVSVASAGVVTAVGHERA